MKMVVPFGPWLPDQPDFKNPGLLTVTDLLPLGDCYAPRQSSGFTGATLNGVPLGSGSATSQAGTRYSYLGTSSKLYMSAGALGATDKSGVAYATAAGDFWEFESFDRNYKMIATNYTDPVQSQTIGAAGNFADMITSTLKPKAKHIAIVGQFVVLGFTNDATDGVRRSRVWWSGFGDETDFDPDAATQCDFEDLSSGGAVQKIIGGAEYGLIFQEHMVRTMRYVGGSAIFEFQPLNFVPGALIPNSVVACAGKVFYLSRAGFAMLDGASVTYIGHDSIDRQLLDNSTVILTYLPGLSVATAMAYKIIAWACPLTTTLPTVVFLYNWESNVWAQWAISGEIEYIARYPLDITQFTFLVANTSHKLGTLLAGSTKTGIIETGDIQLANGRIAQVNSVRPIYNKGISGDAVNLNVSVARHQNISDAVTYSAASAANSDGLCNFRVSGRYHRFLVSLSATWSFGYPSAKYQGLEVDYEIEGDR